MASPSDIISVQIPRHSRKRENKFKKMRCHLNETTSLVILSKPDVMLFYS